MSIDPVLVEIGENTFSVRPMNPFAALNILGDLQKIIIPVIGNLAAIIDSNTKLDKITSVSDLLGAGIDFSKIGQALSNASNEIDGQTICKLAQKLITKELISVEFMDGTQSKMDDEAVIKAFTGKMSEMLQLIWKIAEVNYSDFFTLMPKDFGNALVAAKQQKK